MAAVLLTVTSACAAVAGPGPADPNTVRIGTLAAVANATFMLEPELRTLERKGLRAEITTFADGPTAMQAMAAGQLDVVFAAIGPAATWRNRGIELKVVAGSGNGGQALFCRRGAISSVSDLAGQTIVSVSPGSVTDIIFRSALLPSHGLAARDVNIVVATGYAESANSVFVSREAPCAMSAEPGPARTEVAFGGQTQILFDAAQYWRERYGQSYPATLMLASEQFIEERPAQLTSVLESHHEITQFIRERPDQALPMLTRALKLDNVEVVRRALSRVELTTRIDPAATVPLMEMAVQLGYLDKVPRTDNLFDLQFLRKVVGP